MSYTCNSPLLGLIKEEADPLAQGDTDENTRNKQARTNTFTRNSHLHSLNTRDLGASLPLPLKLVPPTTSTPVQVIQYNLLCWTYGPLGRN